MFAFGTSERAHADLMLYGILNAACDASRGNPPSERDINQVLAAVTGIGAKDGDTDGGNAYRYHHDAAPPKAI
jgi:hypothetical protein